MMITSYRARFHGKEARLTSQSEGCHVTRRTSVDPKAEFTVYMCMFDPIHWRLYEVVIAVCRQLA